MEMYVRARALNLRSTPGQTPTNIVGSLDLNQKVLTNNAPIANGWLGVDATVNGVAMSGFVSATYLRPAVSAQREALLAATREEWLRFDRGQGEEHIAPYSGYVGEMWTAIGQSLTGKDRDIPWSAAAVSFMVRQATTAHASYGKFRFAAAHSRYTHDAIVKRKANDKNAPFWGFERHERKPELGDIVCKARAGSGATFELASKSDSFKSHGDIVVAIDSPNFRLLAIGGNVSHSMSITEYPLINGDYLGPDSGIFAVLGNMTDTN